MIWRHAFECQLNEYQRYVLVALASLPASAALHDLETSFRKLCTAAGLRVHGRDFLDAVRVLDDSFIAISVDFVAVANPSIIDFVAAWLTDSHDESLAAIRGAVYFSQLEWLNRAVVETVPDARRHELVDALECAVTERWMSDEASWTIGEESEDAAILDRDRVDLTQRAIWICKALLDRSTGARPIVDWFKNALPTVFDAWRKRDTWASAESDALRAPVDLISLLKRIDLLSSDAINAAKQFVTRTASSRGDSWLEAIRLREVAPSAFTEKEWEQLVGDVREWVKRALRPQGGLDSLDDVRDVERIADEFEIEINRNDVELLVYGLRIEEERASAAPWRTSDAEPSARRQAGVRSNSSRSRSARSLPGWWRDEPCMLLAAFGPEGHS